jgi:DNA replication protein DnaC
VPTSKAGAELLFEVIAMAYERSSVILTMNLPLENWTEILGNERLTGAALNRLPIVATFSKLAARATD